MIVPGEGIARSVALIVGFSFFVAVFAQIAVRLPFTPVPVTGQTLAVLLAGGALGAAQALWHHEFNKPRVVENTDSMQGAYLGPKFSDEQILDYYLANFIRGAKWIMEFNQENWADHMKIVQSLQYFYENDIEKLLTFVDDFDILFKCDNGNHPKLIKAYLGKKITLETLVILEKVLQYKEVFDKDITEKFIWPKVSKLIKDYEPFMKVSTRKYRMITLNKVQECF